MRYNFAISCRLCLFRSGDKFDMAERVYLVTGSRGQGMINPSVSEARQGRIALGKLLGQLDLPESTRDAVRNARNAAEARWSRAS